MYERGEMEGSYTKRVVFVYERGEGGLLLLAAVVLGAVTEPNLVWRLGDSPKAFDALKEYEQALKNKK